MNEISQKQLDANRENAKLGGVKTEEGKAISKYNALKHGLLSKEILLDGEDEGALIDIGKKLRAELEPKTELELVLVDRITANVWRLKRVMQIEKEMMDNDMSNSISFSMGKADKTLGGALSYDFANRDTYGKLIRYEASIERGIYKALHELQRIQATRMGEKVPLPMAVDINTEKE
ncbi:MAG: hypothetical protein PHZ07_02090 [Patescibacteria group bacterium]|nr:hypothetical protein [Patescibacteria group bacterium]MDD4304026.1 hypothetical protein [Patescibacteria group bacterium]MDD4694903.1 hypothetical protein [Patescibacteria group bacterium]